MTDTSTRSSGRRRGLRRAGALTAAAGLLFAGALMGGPAVAAAAAEPAPVVQGAVVPIADEAITPVMEDALVPITEVEQTTRPLGLSIFVASALTVGAGGIATARLLAARKQQQRVPVESRD